MVIDEPPEVNLEDPDWRFPILEWLVEGKLPSDQTEARRIARWAKAFVLIDGELYKCGAAGILMRCIHRDQGRECCKRYMPHMWSPCRTENTCRESFLTRFLLAHGGRRLECHCAML
jgi:hypothetical protein